nr:hypothetical protein [Candidatus Njordarchaeum guaymaensis]
MKNGIRCNGEAQRDVARKVYVADILSSDENELGRLNEERFKKVKVFGTVLDKKLFRSDTKVEYAFASIDDGSGFVIRLKAWGADVVLLDEAELGTTIDVVGRVKHGKDEVYIAPEIVRRIDDPNWEIVRELEIVEDHLREGKARLRNGDSTAHRLSDLKSEILQTVGRIGGNTGIDYDELLTYIKHFSEDEVKKGLRELLSEELIFEPRPGRYRT